MGYHIVNIDSSECLLSCKDGQLTCRVTGEDVTRSIPLEDVASIIITSFSATLHSQLLVAAAQYGVSLIFCQSYQPVSLLLPANRSTDTTLTRAQVDLAKREKGMLWQRTVDAKCSNQLLLAAHLCPNHAALGELRHYERGKHEAKEAICAKIYWSIVGPALGEANFSRERGLAGVNAQLNYAYAVLLAVVLRDLFALGLDPTFGIFHATREHATPLAYDLMEPFRPLLDWRIAHWNRNHPDEREVSKAFRAWAAGSLIASVWNEGRETDLRGCIEAVLRSFRRALSEGKTTLYQPWTPNSTKWAGFL